MKKVLITGAAGFLGGELYGLLKKQGYEVIGTSRREVDELVVCNLSDFQQLFKILEEFRPDFIVNCAATVNWQKSVLADLYDINTALPVVLAAWCKSNKSHLIQISGTLVNGTKLEEIGIDSEDNPDTDYGKTKLLADKAILTSGCRATILRLGGIFGVSGPDHLGINKAIRGAQNGEAPVIFGSGRAKRNYIHVSDAALSIEYCINQSIEGVHYLSGQETLTIKEMLEQVCSVYGVEKGPDMRKGKEAKDQIVIKSPSLPDTKSFRSALEYEK